MNFAKREHIAKYSVDDVGCGNAADAGLRAGDPDLCLTELVDTARQSADGTGKKNPEPDQEALCRDGDAVNRQRILTIAAT